MQKLKYFSNKPKLQNFKTWLWKSYVFEFKFKTYSTLVMIVWYAYIRSFCLSSFCPSTHKQRRWLLLCTVYTMGYYHRVYDVLFLSPSKFSWTQCVCALSYRHNLKAQYYFHIFRTYLDFLWLVYLNLNWVEHKPI